MSIYRPSVTNASNANESELRNVLSLYTLTQRQRKSTPAECISSDINDLELVAPCHGVASISIFASLDQQPIDQHQEHHNRQRARAMSKRHQQRELCGGMTISETTQTLYICIRKCLVDAQTISQSSDIARTITSI